MAAGVYALTLMAIKSQRFVKLMELNILQSVCFVSFHYNSFLVVFPILPNAILKHSINHNFHFIYVIRTNNAMAYIIWNDDLYAEDS